MSDFIKERHPSESEIGREHTALDFYHLNPEQYFNLQNRLKKNKGTAIALVHPYYENSPSSVFHRGFNSSQTTEQAQQQFSNFLQNASPEGPPIFFLQGGNSSDESLAQAQLHLDKANSVVYIVPTYPHSAEPRGSFVEEEQSGSAVKYRNRKNFEELGIEMFRAGAKKLVVGGMNLGISPFDCYDSGCVLNFINSMDKDKKGLFTIKLSKFTWPSTRQTAENLGRRDWKNRL